MNEKLQKRFEELKAIGLSVDLKSSTCSFKMQSHIGAIQYEKSVKELKLDEDDEYLYAPFRALSMFELVAGIFDYTKKGVLEKSYRLLKGQTVYPDHDCQIDNWLGLVCKSWWDKDASEIPPGVNCTLQIDKKWNEKVIDGIKTGALHSVSVTIFHRFEKSHPELGDDFWFHLGEKINGKVVRLIVTEILSYGEISLVWQGADVFAKRLFDIEPSENDTGSDEGGENLKVRKDMKLSRTMAVMLGLDLSKYSFGTLTEVELDEAGKVMFQQDIANRFKALADENTELKNSFAKLVNLKDGETNEEAVQRLICNAESGEKFRTELQDDCMKFAKLAEDLKDDEELPAITRKTIQSASIDELSQFKKEFQAKAELKFPAVCSSCGAELSRSSASRTGESQDGDSDLDVSEYKM